MMATDKEKVEKLKKMKKQLQDDIADIHATPEKFVERINELPEYEIKLQILEDIDGRE